MIYLRNSMTAFNLLILMSGFLFLPFHLSSQGLATPLESQTAREIGQSIATQLLANSSLSPSVKSELERLPDSLLARVLVDFNSSKWAPEMAREIYAKNPQRFRRMLSSLSAEVVNGHEKSFGFLGVHLLYFLHKETWSDQIQDGEFVRTRLVNSEDLFKLIESIENVDSEYAKVLRARYQYRLENPGKAHPLELPYGHFRFSQKQYIDRGLQHLKVVTNSNGSLGEVQDAKAPMAVLKDESIALIEFTGKGNIGFDLDRGDSVIISLKSRNSNRSIVAVTNSQMNLNDIADQFFHLARKMEIRLQDSKLSIISGEYRRTDATVVYLQQRAKFEGVQDIEYNRLTDSLRSREIRYFPRSGVFLEDSTQRKEETGFNVQESESPSRLSLTLDTRPEVRSSLIDLPAGLSRLDINRDGKISVDELQTATPEELLLIFDQRRAEREFQDHVGHLLKLDSSLLGVLLLQDFKSKGLREDYIRALFSESVAKLTRVIQRMQEHPLDKDNLAQTAEGRNAWRILNVLEVAEREEILQELSRFNSSFPSIDLYIENIRSQFSADGQAQTTSSYPLDQLMSVEHLEIPILTQIPLSHFELKPGIIAMSNGNPTPAYLIGEIKPESGMFAILITSRSDHPNLYAVMNSETPILPFLRSIYSRLRHYGVDRTQSNVKIFGDVDRFKGRLSSLSRSFQDEKFGTVSLVDIKEALDLGIELRSARLSQVSIDWDSHRSRSIRLSAPVGIKLFDPKLQLENDGDQSFVIKRPGRPIFQSCMRFLRRLVKGESD